MQTTQNKKFHNQSHREVRTQPSLFCYAIFYSSFIIPYIFRFENFPIKLKRKGKFLKFHVRTCLFFISFDVIQIQECLGILAARCASCNCMTYFYCAPLQVYTPFRSAQNHCPPDNVRPAGGYIRWGIDSHH